MPRSPGFTVEITKAGYRPLSAVVESRPAGAGAAGVAGNVLVGGLMGLAVDATSGATNDLQPNPLKVTLEPALAATPEN